MKKKERAGKAVEILKSIYPDAVCTLTYSDPFQLLVATRLSAQCTDARVNKVTPALFKRFPTIRDFADADIKEIEKYIYSCGFYHAKAESIKGMAQKLLSDFNGKVPGTMNELLSLPGVGRKTANLVLGDAFHKPAIVVDTHCIRITNRLGLVKTKDPKKIEQELKKIIPPAEGNNFCHRIVMFGRDTCPSRNPKCESCPLGKICPRIGVEAKKSKKASII